MNDDYKRLRSQAEKIYFKFLDSADDREAGVSIRNEVRNIVEYFEMNKEPRSIEDRIKAVQQRLRTLDNEASPIMDAGDIDELVDQYDELREELRELDNY